MSRFSAIFVGSLAMLLASTSAHAGLMIDLVSVTPSGAHFSHNYAIHFTTAPLEERLEGGVVVTPGAAGSPDFVTIYDVGLIGGLSTFHGANAPATWAVQVSDSGVNANNTTPNDNPALANVTFRYIGPTLVSDSSFTGFSILSSFSGSALDHYTSQRTDALGLGAGTKISEIGLAPVPAVPEPGICAALTVAVGALTLRRRRGRN